MSFWFSNQTNSIPFYSDETISPHFLTFSPPLTPPSRVLPRASSSHCILGPKPIFISYNLPYLLANPGISPFCRGAQVYQNLKFFNQKIFNFWNKNMIFFRRLWLYFSFHIFTKSAGFLWFKFSVLSCKVWKFLSRTVLNLEKNALNCPQYCSFKGLAESHFGSREES